MPLLTQSGKIILLRVNEVGDSFGPAADAIQVEVVVQLDTHPPGAASGFKLRVDGSQPVRQAMMDLLRDAFNFGWRVNFDHDVPAGRKKGVITRLWVTKDALPAGGGVSVSAGVMGVTPMVFEVLPSSIPRP